MSRTRANWWAVSPIWVRVMGLAAFLLAAFAAFDIKHTVRNDHVVGTVTGVLEVRPETGLMSDLFVFDQRPRYAAPPQMAAMIEVTGHNHLGEVFVVTGIPNDQVTVGASVEAWWRGDSNADYTGPGFGNFARAWIALALFAVAWFAAAKGTERWRLAERAGQ